MRTTIEITDHQRAELLRLAAERGEKGFSSLVREALDRFLAEQASRRDRVAAAQATLGTLSDEEADELRAVSQAIRSSWR